jgi:hypothetical protein
VVRPFVGIANFKRSQPQIWASETRSALREGETAKKGLRTQREDSLKNSDEENECKKKPPQKTRRKTIHIVPLFEQIYRLKPRR